jgi:hypothetical protein
MLKNFNSKNYLFSLIPVALVIGYFSFNKEAANTKVSKENLAVSDLYKDVPMSQFFSLPCGFVSKGPVPAQSSSFVPDGSYPILKYPAGVIVPTWISRPDHINSANGADRVQLQADGNLVVVCVSCNPQKVLWSSLTNGQQGNGPVGTYMALYFQLDGNLVLKNTNGTIIWNSGIHKTCPDGNGGYFVMQNDGNLVQQYNEPDGSASYYLGGTASAGNQSVSNHFGKIQ